MMNKTNINLQIARILSEIASFLRSNTSLRHDQINSIILSFTLIRRVECVLEPCRDKMYQAYSDNVNRLDEFAMQNLLCSISKTQYFNITNLSLGKIIVSHRDFYSQIVSYIKGFSNNVLSILLQLQFESLVAQLNYSKVLYNVINHFAGIDLYSENLSNRLLGDIVSHYSQPEKNKFAGEYTSPEFFSLIVNALLFCNNKENTPANIYDPVCGTGKLLRNAAMQASQSGRCISMYGQDINPSLCATAAIVSMLSGGDSHNIECGDVLTTDSFAEKTFQYIVADPPISVRLTDGLTRKILFDPRFVAGIPSKNDATLLYMQHVISKMDPKGCRSGIFTSPSCLVNGGVGSGESNIRKWMLDADLVDAIIALPKKVDRYSNVQRYLWILDNHKPENRQGKVCLLDCNRIIEDVDIDTSTDEKLVAEVARVLNGKRSADYAVEIPNKSFGIYQITLVSNKDKKKKLVSVPMSASVMDYLEAEGYLIKNASDVKVVRDDYALVPEEPSWSIDYPSTSAYYQIDFESFFTRVEETESSASLLTDVLSEAEEAENLLHALQKQKQPAPSKVLTESGTAWYGKVPSYWKRTVGSSCFDAVPGRTETAPEFSDDETPYLSLPYLRGNAKVEKVSSLKKAIETNTLVSYKDILVVKSGANAGEVIRGREGALSSTLFLVKPSEMAMLDAQYLSYFMLAAEPWFRSQLRGAAVLSLSIKTLQDMAFFLPPLSEQKVIAAYLDGLCTKISRLEELGYINPKLQQYRKSLIYEAVTGKFDLDSLD